MRICFIAPANSYHTQKWCKWFASHNNEVHVISFTDAENDDIIIHSLDSSVDVNGGDFGKIKYLIYAKKIRQIVDRIHPDIINVHYATSYGTAVALSGLKGYVLSVWGADVYDFPKKSFFHKAMLEFSLYRATYIFSTSKAMAVETSKYTRKNIEITPFGVDMDLFNPDKRERNFDDNSFIVGTVKTLAPKYGIDYFLKAIAILKQHYPDIPIEVRIAGKGPSAEEYYQLADSLGISNIVHWLGYISQEEAAKEWANMDVAVIPSTLESESFGVSAVEAEACSIPIIISDIPGLMEATLSGKTSIIVKRCNELMISNALYELYCSPDKRKSMGEMGRQFVMGEYEINSCFEKVQNIFEKISKGEYKNITGVSS